VPAFQRAATLAVIATVFAMLFGAALDSALVLKAAVVVIAGAIVFVLGLRELDLADTFPELTRVPLLGPVLLAARR